MTEKCPFCGREVEGYLIGCLDNGSPACDECIAKEEEAQKAQEANRDSK